MDKNITIDKKRAIMKLTIDEIKSMKSKEKITMLTAYDFSTAGILDGNVDVILVGDSLGMVVLGHENVLDVTINDMVRHTAAVSRAVLKSLVVGDMPANSYNNKKNAILNAKKLIKAGADCVKIENEHKIAQILIENKIPVMGHIGLTPQTIQDYKTQGSDEESANKIVQEAKALEKAGCFGIVLECIPCQLAKKITQELSIPTIGIGSGLHCDGQVLVSNDMLGLFEKFKPAFAKRYINLAEQMRIAFRQYNKEVKEKQFPKEKPVLNNLQRFMFKSKIHRATVTDANMDYEGSITIDAELMKKACIIEGEKVHVLNIQNGERIETYTINGKANSGEICVNGAAAHKFNKGDKIIIVSYTLLNEAEIKKFQPKVVLVDGDNKICV